MGVPSILTGRNINVAENFTVTPDGVLLITNGVDYPKRWDGMTAAAESAGIPQPSAAPTLTDDTGSGSVSASSTYYGGYRYIDDDLTFDENTDPNTIGTPGAQPGSLSTLGSVTTSSGGSHRIDWSGLTASTDTRVKQIELWRSTAGQATTVYRVARLGNNGTITSSADNAGTIRFTVPSGHNLAVNAVITIAGHSVAGYNTSHTVTAVTATTFDSTVAYSSTGTGGTWTLTGFINEDNTDTALQALPALAITNPDGSANSRRFTVPPDFKAVAVPFQGRMWYGVNVEYTSGTVEVSNGSATVTGTSTAWTAAMAGRYFTKVGDTRSYLISSASATSITLSENYAGTGTSGSSYGIRVSPLEKNRLYYSEDQEWESVPRTNERRIDMGHIDDDDTGLMPYASSLFVLQKRHLWRLNFNRQPNVDATISKVADRGCFNQRCWAVYDNVAYLMDYTGPYRFVGGQPDPFCAPIQNLWRDGIVNFAYTHKFHVSLDSNQEVIRFHFTAVIDSIENGEDDQSGEPKWAACYSVRSNKWWMEKWGTAITGSCTFDFGGQLRCAFGTYNDNVMLANQGTTDVVTTPVTGTATDSGASTLTDSGATFTDSILRAPVRITGGTGKGQATRYITTRNSSTQFTVNEAWDVTPDTTSTYSIGGIDWLAKTGTYKFVEVTDKNSASVNVVFQPTTAAASMDIRRYIDHRTSPENFQNTLPDVGDCVATTDGKPDAVVNMLNTKSSIEEASGFARLPLSGGIGAPAQTERYSAIELRGVQGTDAIKIYGLTLEGVQ